MREQSLPTPWPDPIEKIYATIGSIILSSQSDCLNPMQHKFQLPLVFIGLGPDDPGLNLVIGCFTIEPLFTLNCNEKMNTTKKKRRRPSKANFFKENEKILIFLIGCLQ